jgi:hypothetical protein
MKLNYILVRSLSSKNTCDAEFIKPNALSTKIGERSEKKTQNGVENSSSYLILQKLLYVYILYDFAFNCACFSLVFFATQSVVRYCCCRRRHRHHMYMCIFRKEME